MYFIKMKRLMISLSFLAIKTIVVAYATIKRQRATSKKCWHKLTTIITTTRKSWIIYIHILAKWQMCCSCETSASALFNFEGKKLFKELCNFILFFRFVRKHNNFVKTATAKQQHKINTTNTLWCEQQKKHNNLIIVIASWKGTDAAI